MKKELLNYSKLILSKVSFDRYLFYKEYGKALHRLSHAETEKLNQWVIKEFGVLPTSMPMHFQKVRQKVGA
jgi:hypothetical protein